MTCPSRGCKGEIHAHIHLRNWGMCKVCLHQVRLSEAELVEVVVAHGDAYDEFQKSRAAKGWELADRDYLDAAEEIKDCEEHPWYTGKRRPRTGCVTCMAKYDNNKAT